MQKFCDDLNFKQIRVREAFPRILGCIMFQTADLQKCGIYKNVTGICLTKEIRKDAAATLGNLDERTVKSYWVVLTYDRESV